MTNGEITKHSKRLSRKDAEATHVTRHLEQASKQKHKSSIAKDDFQTAKNAAKQASSDAGIFFDLALDAATSGLTSDVVGTAMDAATIGRVSYKESKKNQDSNDAIRKEKKLGQQYLLEKKRQLRFQTKIATFKKEAREISYDKKESEAFLQRNLDVSSPEHINDSMRRLKHAHNGINPSLLLAPKPPTSAIFSEDTSKKK